MYRITRTIDLSDPSATLRVSATDVSHVHVIHQLGGHGLFVVITLRNHQAALIPHGRLSLDGEADGLRACESFRRWLRAQGIPLGSASLKYATPEAYADMVAARAFAVTCLASAHHDPELEARFHDWQANRPVRAPLIRTA